MNNTCRDVSYILNTSINRKYNNSFHVDMQNITINIKIVFHSK